MRTSVRDVSHSVSEFRAHLSMTHSRHVALSLSLFPFPFIPSFGDKLWLRPFFFFIFPSDHLFFELLHFPSHFSFSLFVLPDGFFSFGFFIVDFVPVSIFLPFLSIVLFYTSQFFPLTRFAYSFRTALGSFLPFLLCVIDPPFILPFRLHSSPILLLLVRLPLPSRGKEDGQLAPRCM